MCLLSYEYSVLLEVYDDFIYARCEESDPFCFYHVIEILPLIHCMMISFECRIRHISHLSFYTFFHEFLKRSIKKLHLARFLYFDSEVSPLDTSDYIRDSRIRKRGFSSLVYPFLRIVSSLWDYLVDLRSSEHEEFEDIWFNVFFWLF